MVSPLVAANNIILRAKKEGESITHLKLQKLLYLLYACYLHETDKALFADRFEAWQYGPVLSEVYDEFKKYGSQPITAPYVNNEGIAYIGQESGAYGNCLNATWGKYSKYTGMQLVSLTHEGGTAWSIERERNGLGGFLSDEYIRRDAERWFGN